MFGFSLLLKANLNGVLATQREVKSRQGYFSIYKWTATKFISAPEAKRQSTINVLLTLVEIYAKKVDYP